VLEGRWKDAEEMKQILLVVFLFPSILAAEELRFKIEQTCTASKGSLDFGCYQESREFTIIRTGKKYFGVNHSDGTKYRLSIVESDSYITILKNPVSYSGSSQIHIFQMDGTFYWTEVAYSEILHEQEITVRKGKRIK
jgi:hypothetical protein